MILIWVVRNYHLIGPPFKTIRAVLAFGLTLSIGALALGWYNWARFGSIFETGITYQLAGLDFHKYRSDIFSPLYIIQNLYNYLLYPPKLIYSFPWFRMMNGMNRSILTGLHLPGIYSSQQIVGLFYNEPFVLFALVPVFRTLLRKLAYPGNEGDKRIFNWLVIALIGSFLSMASFFMLFFFSAERYLGDFLPSLLLLSVIGFWQVGRIVATKPIYRLLFVIIEILLIMISLVISNLLALDVNNSGFKALYPVLWRQLSNLFRP
jgi:hypothetical protein